MRERRTTRGHSEGSSPAKLGPPSSPYRYDILERSYSVRYGVKYGETTMMKTNAEASTRTAVTRPSGTKTARSDAAASGDTTRDGFLGDGRDYFNKGC